MKKISFFPLILSWIFFSVVGFFLCTLICKDRDTKEKVETKTGKFERPTPRSVSHVGVVTVPVRLETREPDDPELPKGEILLFPPYNSTPHPDTCRDGVDARDSFVVNVPIERKEYRDSSYTAYVSGYHASLDSIEVRERVVTRTVSVPRFRRWNIGVIGGYGYGFSSGKVEPFVGIGITLNLFR